MNVKRKYEAGDETDAALNDRCHEARGSGPRAKRRRGQSLEKVMVAGT
jgi:hypothetical protein